MIFLCPNLTGGDGSTLLLGAARGALVLFGVTVRAHVARGVACVKEGSDQSSCLRRLMQMCRRTAVREGVLSRARHDDAEAGKVERWDASSDRAS
jgi:hypothetical protein